MLKALTILAGLAAIVLSWRISDPKGSYGVLYDLSQSASAFASNWEVLRRLSGMMIVEHLTGILVGIILVAIMVYLYVGLRWVAKGVSNLVIRRGI